MQRSASQHGPSKLLVRGNRKGTVVASSKFAESQALRPEKARHQASECPNWIQARACVLTKGQAWEPEAPNAPGPGHIPACAAHWQTHLQKSACVRPLTEPIEDAHKTHHTPHEGSIQKGIHSKWCLHSALVNQRISGLSAG